jgi:class 3 adenylate cyclase/outer membrane biosynthesis protein TonB
MQAATNRTFICSVVFLDIVGYSRKPVVEQIQLKERLNALLTEALANVAVNDRIILDTGDGAALSFLGDPEDALFVSLSIRDALAAPSPQGPELPLRLGVNLGPVKLVKDINDQPNIIGDGINVAQRVMSFAQPGQILVSRSYYEVVSCLSEDYGKLFHYEGSRTDKHVREHEVYAVEAGGEALKRVAAATPARRRVSRSGPVALDLLARSATGVKENLRRKPWLATTLAVAAILALAVALRLARQAPVAPVAAPSPPPPKVAAAPPPPAPVQAPSEPKVPEKPVAAKPKPVAPAAKPAPPRKAVETARPPAASPAPPAAPPPAARAPEPAARAPVASAQSESKAPAQAGSGVLLLTVRPWGEIYVDGAHRGDAPPLYELRVGAGKRRLEIRHPDFPPHVRNLDVAPGARIEIRHVFLPKEYPNPLRNLWK